METYVEYDDEPTLHIEADDDFGCPDCGADSLDENGICRNEECPAFEDGLSNPLTDWQERQHERRQMGAGL